MRWTKICRRRLHRSKKLTLRVSRTAAVPIVNSRSALSGKHIAFGQPDAPTEYSTGSISAFCRLGLSDRGWQCGGASTFAVALIRSYGHGAATVPPASLAPPMTPPLWRK